MRNYVSNMQYIQDSVVSNRQILIVKTLKIYLRFGIGHQVADSDLDVLSIVGLEVVHFQPSDLSVEFGQKGHCHCLLSFKPEVKRTIGKGPASESS